MRKTEEFRISDAIPAVPESFYRTVETTLASIESQNRKERNHVTVSLRFGKRALIALVAALVLLVAATAFAATAWILRENYDPATYLETPKDVREGQEAAIPDVEQTIASAKPKTAEYSVKMLSEMDDADELNRWRTELGQPAYAEADWAWVREIVPSIQEVLYDGNMLSFSIRLSTDHAASFAWGQHDGQCTDAITDSAVYSAEGDGMLHPMCDGGTGVLPESVTADGLTLFTEYEVDAFEEPFPTDGRVTIIVRIAIQDRRVDDMAHIGQIGEITYAFSFDTSAGTETEPRVTTDRALFGTYTLSYEEGDTLQNKRVSLDGVVLSEQVVFQPTGICVSYRIKETPEGWTEADTRALMRTSFESSQQFGLAAQYTPDATAGQDGTLYKPEHPYSAAKDEVTFLLPIFPSEYDRIRTNGYGLTLSYRCIDTFNDAAVGSEWSHTRTASDYENGYDLTSHEQRIVSFLLPNP